MCSWIRNTLLFIGLLALPTCATDPGSSTSIAGSAICTYDNCDADVIVNVVASGRSITVWAATMLFAVNSAGVREMAASVDPAVVVTYAPQHTFTVNGSSQSLTLLSSETSPNSNYFLASYQYGAGSSTDEVVASMTVALAFGGSSRTLNGSGGSSETSPGGGTSSLTHHTIFATSTTYAANMGGLTQADALCAARAAAGSQTSALPGTWKAILSDDTTSAASRLSLQAIAIKNTAGQTVENYGPNLWVGNLVTPISLDENGNAGADFAWTSTTATGASNGSPYTCTNWTSTSALLTPTVGQVNLSTTRWIASIVVPNCAEIYHLYCINQ